MYLQNCGLLMCKGQELSFQESLQERLALINSNKPIASKKTDVQPTSQKDNQKKEVFSFKLNGFRKYGDSDKVRENTHQKNGKANGLQMGKIQYYRSSEKISLKTSCMEPKLVKIHNSPLPSLSYPMTNDHGVVFKRPLNLKQVICQHNYSPKIIFKMVNNNICENKIGPNNSSEQPEISSIISKQKEAEIQIKQIDQSQIGQTSQSISTVQLQRQQKCDLSNSNPSLIFNNSHTQQLNGSQNPTFKQIKNCEPKRLFENIKTLKTIHTTSEFKENSAQNSTQNFAYPIQGRDQYQQHQSRITTQKNFMRKKKKTAFFGFLQKEDKKQNQSNYLRQNYIQEGSIENESFEEENQSKNKKVHFLFQSQNDTENESFVKTQQKPNTQYIKFQQKCRPSLNSIVQSAALMSVQIKQTPLNSIKEMIFQRSPQQSSPKFKYINTIKSIGGDSLYSQNSYLDLKFMQSIQSRRALYKLI